MSFAANHRGAGMMICTICEEEFDEKSTIKKKAGGLINHCPDCAIESSVPYAGVASADGKIGQISILKFSKKDDREKYLAFWKNNSGMHKSKSCQLGNHLSSTPAVSFETVQGFNPTNHKGKAN